MARAGLDDVSTGGAGRGTTGGGLGHGFESGADLIGFGSDSDLDSPSEASATAGSRR
jgi:hypothetical protein